MNKQELIEKLKQHGAWCTECHDIKREKDRYVKVAKVRELLDQLDAPVKPEVPQFVAEWFEANKDDLEYNIWNYIFEWRAHEAIDFKFWMGTADNEPLETLIRMKDGYTVKQEPKYYVALPSPSPSNILHYLHMSAEGHLNFFTKKDCPQDKCRFSKDEVTEIDERYWAFAVPVDNSVEEV